MPNPQEVIIFRSKVAMEEAQRALERAILATPTSETRNELTDMNMRIMVLIERLNFDPAVNRRHP